MRENNNNKFQLFNPQLIAKWRVAMDFSHQTGIQPFWLNRGGRIWSDQRKNWRERRPKNGLPVFTIQSTWPYLGVFFRFRYLDTQKTPINIGAIYSGEKRHIGPFLHKNSACPSPGKKSTGTIKIPSWVLRPSSPCVHHIIPKTVYIDQITIQHVRASHGPQDISHLLQNLIMMNFLGTIKRSQVTIVKITTLPPSKS